MEAFIPSFVSVARIIFSVSGAIVAAVIAGFLVWFGWQVVKAGYASCKEGLRSEPYLTAFWLAVLCCFGSGLVLIVAAA